jgi:predicted dienelactone hydrolase
MTTQLRCITVLFVSLLNVPIIAADYDPLALPKETAVTIKDLTVKDDKRTREIPIKVYLPAASEPGPVVLFSHGLGGSREGSPFLGKHWAARGYVCVFLQHPGSDEGVWKDVRPLERMAALRAAADAKNFLLRVQDVPAVLDQLETWNAEEKHALQGRLNLERVGMSGHSFGAVTTQAVSGQSAARGRISVAEKRITAALPMSPSTPKAAEPKQAFGSVKIPWLLMTGTNDTSPIGDQTVESRLAVFPALPAGSKYELVLNKAEHSVFTERALPGDKAQRNPKHHPAILAISTAFWDAYLRDDKAAREWLDGDGPQKVLEKEDRWTKK